MASRIMSRCTISQSLTVTTSDPSLLSSPTTLRRLKLSVAYVPFLSSFCVSLANQNYRNATPKSLRSFCASSQSCLNCRMKISWSATTNTMSRARTICAICIMRPVTPKITRRSASFTVPVTQTWEQLLFCSGNR